MTKKLFALFFLMFLLTGCMENTVTPTEKEGTSATDETLPAETGDTTAPATTEPTATEPTDTTAAPATGDTGTVTEPTATQPIEAVTDTTLSTDTTVGTTDDSTK